MAASKDLEDLEEQQPLLAGERSDDLDDDDDDADLYEIDEGHEGLAQIIDPMTYTLNWLKGWKVFSVFQDTVWDNTDLWTLMLRLLLIAVVVALFTYFLMPDPSHLDASKFSAITSTLTLFVTLMLTFFLSSSVSRWIACVSGFLGLFNSIRNLAMQLHALGVEHEKADLCLRYGVLSAKFLVYELRSLQLSQEQKTKATEAMWRRFSQDKRGILDKEKQVLKDISDKAGQMWVWVASMVGRMAKDGDIPPMESPTYGRIMGLAEDAQHGLRQVRTSVVVQMPFVYVHTLAVLVHVNSILMAVNLGLGAGATIHGIQQNLHHMHYTSPINETNVTNAANATFPFEPFVPVMPLTSQIQTLIVEVLKGVIGPLLFQAFFQIGVAVATPFGDPDAAIPVARLLKALQKDIDDSARLSENPPHWQKPAFKVPKVPIVKA